MIIIRLNLIIYIRLYYNFNSKVRFLNSSLLFNEGSFSTKNKASKVNFFLPEISTMSNKGFTLVLNCFFNGIFQGLRQAAASSGFAGTLGIALGGVSVFVIVVVSVFMVKRKNRSQHPNPGYVEVLKSSSSYHLYYYFGVDVLVVRTVDSGL